MHRKVPSPSRAAVKPLAPHVQAAVTRVAQPRVAAQNSPEPSGRARPATAQIQRKAPQPVFQQRPPAPHVQLALQAVQAKAAQPGPRLPAPHVQATLQARGLVAGGEGPRHSQHPPAPSPALNRTVQRSPSALPVSRSQSAAVGKRPGQQAQPSRALVTGGPGGRPKVIQKADDTASTSTPQLPIDIVASYLKDPKEIEELRKTGIFETKIRLGRQLGQGNFKTVYQVEGREGLCIAVANSAEMNDNVWNEFQSLSKLREAGLPVVRVYDFLSDFNEGRHAFTMDTLTGTFLKPLRGVPPGKPSPTLIAKCKNGDLFNLVVRHLSKTSLATLLKDLTIICEFVGASDQHTLTDMQGFADLTTGHFTWTDINPLPSGRAAHTKKEAHQGQMAVLLAALEATLAKMV